MYVFYHAVMKSLLRYGMSAWYDNLTAQSKAKQARKTNSAMKTMANKSHHALHALYDQSVLR